MNQIELTDWFPANVKPAHVGWYEKEFELMEGPDAMQFWDGAQWFYGSSSAFAANEPRSPTTFMRRWRGLRSPA